MKTLQIVSGLLIGLAFFIYSSAAVAESAPTVFEDYDPEGPRVEYTVTNPSPSTVGDIVAFVIDLNPSELPYGHWADTANQWNFQDLAADDWTSDMTHYGYPSASFPLTWQAFFGGIDYPFGTSPAAGYFVGYSEVSPGLYQFDSPSLAISPGESLGQFVVEGRALSTFYLAYIGDAANDTFDSNGLPYVSGEAVPEPCTLILLGMAALGLLAYARRRN
jgi:hypothetical protein